MNDKGMDDKEIIDLYFARNEKAISKTSQKYGRLLRYIAYNILKNPSDSEECENDTYLAAWNKIPPNTPTSLSAFLGRIVRNIAFDKHDYYTADKRNEDFNVLISELGDVLSDKNSVETEYEKKEIAEYINAYLNGKKYEKRIVFIRRYWYCDTIADIAVNYGFSESKVKSMLMRMRKELKIYFERNGIII